MPGCCVCTSFLCMDLRRIEAWICGDASFIAAGFLGSVRAAADGGDDVDCCVCISLVCMTPPHPNRGEILEPTTPHSLQWVSLCLISLRAVSSCIDNSDSVFSYHQYSILCP